MADYLDQLKERALSLAVAGQLEPTLATYHAHLDATPGDAAVRRQMADLLLGAGRWEEALSHYATTAEQLAVQGNVLWAMAICQIMLLVDPQRTSVHKMLADLYARRKGHTVSPGRDLPAIPLFSDLGKAAFQAVVSKAVTRQFGPGQVIIKEGSPGDSMFALVQGEVDVVRGDTSGGGTVLAHVGPGAFFGEMALLAGTARLASVVATTDCTTLEWARGHMLDVMDDHPSVAKAVEKLYRERLLGGLMRSNELFCALSEERRHDVAASFRGRSVEPNTVLVLEGRPSDGLYVILRGQCVVTQVREDGSNLEVARLREGDVFGEMSMVLGGPAAATVRAVEPSVVLKMTRAAFERIVLSQPEARAVVTSLAEGRRRMLTEISLAARA
jgi:CRP-like cAMP-binding protein